MKVHLYSVCERNWEGFVTIILHITGGGKQIVLTVPTKEWGLFGPNKERIRTMEKLNMKSFIYTNIDIEITGYHDIDVHGSNIYQGISIILKHEQENWGGCTGTTYILRVSDYKWVVTKTLTYYATGAAVDEATYHQRKKDAMKAREVLEYADRLLGAANAAATKEGKLENLKAAIEQYRRSIGYNNLQATREGKTRAERQRDTLQSQIDRAKTAFDAAEALMREAGNAPTKAEKLQKLKAAVEQYNRSNEYNNLPATRVGQTTAESQSREIQSAIDRAAEALNSAEELMCQADNATTNAKKLKKLKEAIKAYDRSIGINNLQATRERKIEAVRQQGKVKLEIAETEFDAAEELMGLANSTTQTKPQKLKKLKEAIKAYDRSIGINNLQATQNRKQEAERQRAALQSDLDQAVTALNRAEALMCQADNAATNAEKLQKLKAAIEAYDFSIEYNDLPATRGHKQKAEMQRNALYLAEAEGHIEKGDRHIKIGDMYLQFKQNSSANDEYNLAFESLKKALENHSSDTIKDTIKGLLDELKDRYHKLGNVAQEGDVENILKDKFNHIVSSTSHSFFTNDRRQRTQPNIDQKTLANKH